MVKNPCKRCGKQIPPQKTAGRRRVYCSPKCYHETNKEQAKERNRLAWKEDHEGMLAYSRHIRAQRKAKASS